MDTQYIRPFLIYKYKKVKKRIEFEFEDILKEYQQIEDELNQDSSEDEALVGVPSEFKALSHEIASQGDMSASQNGLLAQYIRTKMARQAVGEFYMSTRLSEGA